MAILVGIWSRDTETKLSENLGSRLYLMELALAATQAKCQALSAKHKIDGVIKSIFVAPEYLFSAPRDDPGAARAVSHITRSALKSLLAEKSRKFQHMLIVPGTIIFKMELAEYPILGEAKKVRALKILEVAQAKPKEFPVAEIGGVLSTAEKNRLLKEGQATQLIKNRAYVFLNGSAVFSYGKKADMVEAIGADSGPSDRPVGVFVPGLKAGLAEIAGIQFGFEICWEHEKGVLKTIASASKVAPDIQIICSAHVDNAKQNMVVRPGGFVIHASSKLENSNVYYKAPVPQGAGKFVQPKSYAADEQQAQEKVLKFGEETVGGSPLSYYVINNG